MIYDDYLGEFGLSGLKVEWDEAFDCVDVTC